MSEHDFSTSNVDSLSLDHMRAFISVVETGSQVSAAKRLRVAQTTVSRHVERVQAHFGGGLFETGAGARLSTRGLLVERCLRSVLAEVSLSRSRLSLDRPVLRIGFIRIMRPIVERALRALVPRQGEPDFDVRLIELRTEQHLPKLQNRELDITVSYAFGQIVGEGGEVEESVVIEQPFALVVPERACARGKLLPRAVRSLHYAHLPRRFSTELADSALRWLSQNQLTFGARVECELGTEIIAYAASGRGFGFLPALWRTTNHDGAVFLPAPEFARTARIMAYSLPHVSPWLKPFRDSLLQAARASLKGFP